MIGVIVNTADREIVREFFELFKTPWEFFAPGRQYDVVVSTTGETPDIQPELLLAYGSESGHPLDASPAGVRRKGVSLHHGGNRIPIYGNCLAFEEDGAELPIDEAGGGAATRHSFSGKTVLRIGFDLFEEIRFLLTTGQPLQNAPIAALDRHIALLRDLITGTGLPVVEIPPVPAGFNFIVCLTHDVDHPVLRNHRFDHTALGFLYRATVGSVKNVCRGRMPVRHLLKNWIAALRFPLVQLGLARDFWRPFDRYMDIEEGLASTFFVIPRSGAPGRRVPGNHPEARAARYDLEDIAPQLERIRSRGGEIGLHGIDAWADVAEGRSERSKIEEVDDSSGAGVRMHWLCFDANSPAILEEAGFAYDSTFGYNEAVGYRAGTLQAFKQPGTSQLIELPLHIMDTALFYPGRMNLSSGEAAKRMRTIFADAVRFGGALTLNWHDRSIAPERLWDEFYVEMLEELKQLEPWFATARNAVRWFQVRRSAVFEEVRREGRVVKVKVSTPGGGKGLPGLRLRVSRNDGDRPSDSDERGDAVHCFEEDFSVQAEISLAA